jgi:hypothetical protein
MDRLVIDEIAPRPRLEKREKNTPQMPKSRELIACPADDPSHNRVALVLGYRSMLL